MIAKTATPCRSRVSSRPGQATGATALMTRDLSDDGVRLRPPAVERLASAGVRCSWTAWRHGSRLCTGPGCDGQPSTTRPGQPT